MANQQIHIAQFAEQSSTPATPGAGNRKLYPRDDGWYEVDSAGNDIRASANIGVGVIKTISTGVVAVGVDRNIVVAAESGTTDTLDEVTGLSVGESVWLRADTGDTITVTHNAAGATVKIHLIGDTDYVLDEQNAVELVLVATNVLVQTGNVAINQISPLTTKGDLFTYDTADARLAVGTDGQVLTADSAQSLGIKWSTATTPAMETIIAPTTLGSPASNIQLGTVTSDPLPTSYSQWLLAMNVRGSASSVNCRLQFNNDTGTNYYYYTLRIDDAGTLTAITGYGNQSYACSINAQGTGGAANEFGWAYFYISGHDTTNYYTVVQAESFVEQSTTISYRFTSDGYWQNTAVVQEIDIVAVGGNFATNTTYALYGIK